MSQEQLNAFATAMKADSSLQNQISSAKTPDAVLEIAKKAGYSLSLDDLKQLSSLSEDELANISGGSFASYGHDLNKPLW